MLPVGRDIQTGPNLSGNLWILLNICLFQHNDPQCTWHCWAEIQKWHKHKLFWNVALCVSWTDGDSDSASSQLVDSQVRQYSPLPSLPITISGLFLWIILNIFVKVYKEKFLLQSLCFWLFMTKPFCILVSTLIFVFCALLFLPCWQACDISRQNTK